MMRRAGPADLAELTDFLRAHIETSMFLLGNLEAHGLNASDHPHATTYILRCETNRITGVFGATQGGYLMCQMPALSRDEARAALRLLPGHPLRGITGDVAQVATFLEVLPVLASDWEMNVVQPLYATDIADVPFHDAHIRAARRDERIMLERWFADYLQDTGFSQVALAVDEVAVRAAAAIGAEDVVLLADAQDIPIAMSAINARAGDVVQVGGVFVPRDLRGQGLAGRVVAAQLHALARTGVTRAILFAASTDAARAYEKIGFRHIGGYRIAMLGAPTTLEPAL